MTILKASLEQKNFWNDPSHPIRRFLNELAETRPSSGLTDELEKDPFYLKARELTKEFVTNYDDDHQVVTSLLSELEAYRRQYADSASTKSVELPPGSRKQCRRRLDEARERADRKIRERTHKEPLPPVIRDLLQSYLRDFLVEVILAQGTGGNSWKPIMKTIDLLVWSVRPGKSETDREKLARVNEKLLSNIRKALRVIKLDSREIENLLAQITKAQESSFGEHLAGVQVADATTSVEELHRPASPFSESHTRQPADSRFMEEAVNLPVGIWMEFIVDRSHTIHCTLAAKVTDPTRYIFVNRQGVKVLEKPVADVACELEAGSARQVSENLLLDRAIDTVIARLRARNEKKPSADQDLDSAA